MSAFELFLLVVILVIMIAGLYFIFVPITKRQDKSADSQTVQHKNDVPIIPRSQREFEEKTPENSAPASDQASDLAKQTQATADKNLDQPDKPSEVIAKQDSAKVDDNDAFADLAAATETVMPAVEVAEEVEFTDQSSVIDRYLNMDEADKNSPLETAQMNVNVSLLPSDGFGRIRGVDILAMVDRYGLKYGVLNMFHRYEEKNGDGILYFSMMAITSDGVGGFDINQLPEREYNGLVLFLPLPHPKALQGFDMMAAIAEMMAKDLKLQVYDEENVPFAESKSQLRIKVEEYSPV